LHQRAPSSGERGDVDNSKKNLPLGLGGVFRGLSDLLQIAIELAERMPDTESSVSEVQRTGEAGSPKGLHAVYGVSVRVGGRGAPVVAQFGNVRQNAANEPVIDEEREPMVDVLDEVDYYIVIAELPGVAAEAVEWSLRGDRVLAVRAASEVRKYVRDIPLTEPVARDRAVSCFENGMLQVKLWKKTV
jgi:HSP20 family protein